ncbi:MAG TPA: hypothetical protein PLU26_02270 [Candidatus Competibacter sp.]|nr:hypothetical protein [Candidatus Competibacter sp.]
MKHLDLCSGTANVMTVAVLFARTDSVYKTIPGCDVYDIERDARRWPGGCTVIAHPPCRAWGQLRFFAKPRPDEKSLAIWAVDQVRRWGGVLEHPVQSTLWPAAGLPLPGKFDKFGGFTLVVDQFWWGHRARKRTNLYIVGCAARHIPLMPLVLGDAPMLCGTSGRRLSGERHKNRPEIPKREREATPLAFAHWLLALARRCTIQTALEAA